jgi:hypothetical protein
MKPNVGAIGEELEIVPVPSGPRGRLAGTHIDDQVALTKMIVLCEFCNPKFNPRKNRYEVWRKETWVRGACDGCSNYTLHGRGFIHQSFHEQVGEWENRPMSARRGRWAR